MTTSTSSILFKNALQWDYRFLLWSVQHASYRRFVKNKGNFPRLRTNKYVRYSYNLLTFVTDPCSAFRTNLHFHTYLGLRRSHLL